MRKSSLGRDALYLSGSRIVIALISLVTSMLLARFRTLAEFGTYSQVILVSDLISTVLLLGLPNSINYFLSKAETREDRQRFLSVYYTISTAVCLFVGAFSVAAIPLFVRCFDNPLIVSFWFVLAIYPWASFILSSIGNICIVHGKADKLVLYNVTFAITNLFILLFVKAMNWSFMSFMLLFMGFYAACALFIYWWTYKMAGSYRVMLDRKLVRNIFVFSVPLGLASVVGTLNIELDKLVIGAFYTTSQYAIYACAAKEIPVTMIVAAFTAVLLPRLVRFLKNNDSKGAARCWSNCSVITFSLISLIACGMFVFAPDVIFLFYGGKYLTAECINVFRIFCVVLLLKFTYYGIVLNSSGKTKIILLCALASLLLNLICNILFYYIFGFYGPALATLAVLALMSLLQLVFTAKIISIKLCKLLDWLKLGRIFATNLILSISFFSTKVFWEQQGSWRSVFLALGSGVVWAGVFVLVNRKMLINCWKAINIRDDFSVEQAT